MIAYATKTGTTRKAAQQLAEALRAHTIDVALADLAQDAPMPDADVIVLGGSVRMGQWNKRALHYAKANEQSLLRKPFAVFACRCGHDDTRALLAPQLGEALTKAALDVVSLGGEMDISKQKGLDRFVAKMVSKHPDAGMESTGIDAHAVEALAKKVAECVISQ